MEWDASWLVPERGTRRASVRRLLPPVPPAEEELIAFTSDVLASRAPAPPEEVAPVEAPAHEESA